MTQSDQRAFYETYDKHHQAELINRLMKKVRRHYDLASIERLKEASYSPIFARYGEKWSQLAHLCLATSPSATMVVPWVTKGLEKFQIPIPVTKDTRPVQVAQLWYPIINDLLSTLVINNQVEAAAMLAKWIQAQLEPKTTSALSLEDSQKTVSPPDVPEKYQWLLSPPLPQNQQSSDPPSSEQEVSSAQPPSPLLPALEIPPAKSTIQSRKRSGSIRSQDKDSNPVAKSKSPPSRYPYKPIHRNEQHILLELLFKRAVWAYKLRRREMQTALLEGLSCLHLQDSAFRSECDTLQTTGVLDSVQQISLETSHDDDAGSSSSSSDASTIQNTLAATDDLEVVPQHPDKYDFPSNYQILLSGARVMQISKPMGLNKPKYDQPKTGEFRRVTDQSESENDESLASESSDSDSDAD
ncbi:hypothetical protein H4R35_001433 [Dimargaris xerosporica]|nr:hypothetical protein H4R35_001433 [Dimargaris xerosporica]